MKGHTGINTYAPFLFFPNTLKYFTDVLAAVELAALQKGLGGKARDLHASPSPLLALYHISCTPGWAGREAEPAVLVSRTAHLSNLDLKF